MSLVTLVEGLSARKDSKPLLCMEVNPPRGVDSAAAVEKLAEVVELLDFINVTDSALARMKCAALPFAAMLKQKLGVEPLVNVACRDRNLIAMQGDLLAAWMTGVRSIVALTGDAVTTGDCPQVKSVFEVNSVGLLGVISKLNSGEDIVGNQLRGQPSFISGVVVNPNAKNTQAELRRLEKKKVAGAKYALSQPVFDAELSSNFFKEAQTVGIPIMVGLLPFKNARAASAIAEVPGIRLSPKIDEHIQNVPSDKDLSEYSIGHCLEIATACREFVCGFHVVSGASPRLGARLVREIHQMFCSS